MLNLLVLDISFTKSRALDHVTRDQEGAHVREAFTSNMRTSSSESNALDHSSKLPLESVIERQSLTIPSLRNFV